MYDTVRCQPQCSVFIGPDVNASVEPLVQCLNILSVHSQTSVIDLLNMLLVCSNATLLSLDRECNAPAQATELSRGGRPEGNNRYHQG